MLAMAEATEVTSFLQILQCLPSCQKMLAPHGKASLLLLLQEGSVPEVPDVADQSEATEEDVDAELEALAQVCYSIVAVVCF